MISCLISLMSSGDTRAPSSSLTGDASISMPALMITTEIRAPRMPSREIPQISMMPADTSVAVVMMASNRASEPEAVRASLFSCLPFRLTYHPSRSLTTMATMMTMSVGVV